MCDKLFATLAVLLHLVSPILSADVAGYLGTACNGENLYEVTPQDGVCVILTGVQVADSFTVVNFGNGEFVNFYSDAGCVNLVGTASTEECFLVPHDGVQSFAAL